MLDSVVVRWCDDLSREVCQTVAGHARIELLDGDGLPGGQHGAVDFAVGAFPYQGIRPEVSRDVVQLAHGNRRHIDGEDLRRPTTPGRIRPSWFAAAWHRSKLAYEEQFFFFLLRSQCSCHHRHVSANKNP